MKIEKKQVSPSVVELTIRINKDEAAPLLSKAAALLSAQKAIPGFRPGKAPYEVVKKHFGEPTIVAEAMEDIINDSISKALEQEKLHPYGQIGFDLLPVLALDEIAAFKAMITLMPSVRLGNWQSGKIKRSEPKITDDEMTKALDELSQMATMEEVVDRPAKLTDKVILDFEVFVDGKLIDGGHASDFALILGEGKMIPGFEEQIVDKSPGKIEFNLNFPSIYHAQSLAGKPAEFKITLKQVFARNKPTIDDEFAKRMGVADVKELKQRLHENILKEKQMHEEEKVEIASIKQLADTAKFDEIPAAMISDTVEDLIADFNHNLAHQNINVESYLKSINKTADQLRTEFEPRALERVRASLALGQLAEDQKISIAAEEIEHEAQRQKQIHAGHKHAIDDINKPEYRRHIANSLINRKLIEFIKTKIVE